jgi:hypothetical protein
MKVLAAEVPSSPRQNSSHRKPWGQSSQEDAQRAKIVGMPVPNESLCFKENTEYEVILSNLSLDHDRKKWVAFYLLNM